MPRHDRCRNRRTPGSRALHSTAAENLGPMGEPEQPLPWCQLDPQEVLDPCDDFEEPELPTIPMVIGPASSGPAGPASGVDLGTGRMAAELHWNI